MNLLNGACLAGPQLLLNQAPTTHSRSGQFVVQKKAGNSRLPRAVLAASTNAGFVRLDTTTLAVSAERLKARLYRELEVTGPWRSKIYLCIAPAQTTNDQVIVASERLNDGWQYGVELPEVIDRIRFVRALTQTLLLEYANRSRPARCAEVPFWLSESLAGQLLGSSEAEIILPAPEFSGNGSTVAAAFVDVRREYTHSWLRRQFADVAPLSFEELSWPSAEAVSGQLAAHYRASAMLLLNELFRLPQGRASLRTMISELPQYHNWQFAFLRAFKGTFQRPLEVEKWWDLQAAHFTGRDGADAWSNEESWLKLDEVLGASVEVRTATNDLPRHARITLQAIITEWTMGEQRTVLRDKVLQLQWVRLRTTQEYAAVIDEYRQALMRYLEKSGRLPEQSLARDNKAHRRFAQEVIEQLDQLDARRQDLRPQPAGLAGR